MAFHLHLIHPFWDELPASGLPLPPNVEARSGDESRLFLAWEIAGDGRPRARWMLA